MLNEYKYAISPHCTDIVKTIVNYHTQIYLKGKSSLPNKRHPSNGFKQPAVSKLVARRQHEAGIDLFHENTEHFFLLEVFLTFY